MSITSRVASDSAGATYRERGTKRGRSAAVLSVLLLVIVCALWIGLPAYQRQVTVNKIRLVHGHVHIERGGGEWLREFANDDQISWFDQVDIVDLRDLRRTDSVLIGHLRTLDGLKELRLDGTRITDADLQNLSGMTILEQLSLGRTRITDGGLQHLTRLKSLQLLAVNDTRVTDVGMSEIGQLPYLRWLDLCDTQVSDNGLGHLYSLSELRWLYLGETNVTSAGVAKLQQALPRCNISLSTSDSRARFIPRRRDMN